MPDNQKVDVYGPVADQLYNLHFDTATQSWVASPKPRPELAPHNTLRAPTVAIKGRRFSITLGGETPIYRPVK